MCIHAFTCSMHHVNILVTDRYVLGSRSACNILVITENQSLYKRQDMAHIKVTNKRKQTV